MQMINSQYVNSERYHNAIVTSSNLISNISTFLIFFVNHLLRVLLRLYCIKQFFSGLYSK